jgi:hypothetical protein
MDSKRLLPVEVSDGLFPSERIAKFPTSEGDVSVFVGVHHLEGSALRVTLLDQDENHALVEIPSQCGLTVAKVSREAVNSAPVRRDL